MVYKQNCPREIGVDPSVKLRTRAIRYNILQVDVTKICWGGGEGGSITSYRCLPFPKQKDAIYFPLPPSANTQVCNVTMSEHANYCFTVEFFPNSELRIFC